MELKQSHTNKQTKNKVRGIAEEQFLEILSNTIPDLLPSMLCYQLMTFPEICSLCGLLQDS